MGWETPNARRHTATQEALRGVLSRLYDLESAPSPGLDLDPIHHELTSIRTELSSDNASITELVDTVTGLTVQAKEFVIALAEGIERTDRAERRIKATVARARKELKARGYEDPGLDSEAYELRDADGDGGEIDGVLPLRAGVEEPAQEASSISGVSLETLRRVRGY